MANAKKIQTLSKIIAQPQITELEDRLGKRLLHIMAKKNNLNDFLKEIQNKEVTHDWFQKCLKIENTTENTFLAVAANSVTSEKMEDDILKVIELMIDICNSRVVSELCEKKDKQGNSLLPLGGSEIFKETYVKTSLTYTRSSQIKEQRWLQSITYGSPKQKQVNGQVYFGGKKF